MSISRLTTEAGADVSRQAVTKHLRIMHDAGIVKERRLGRESIWELEPRKLDEARNYLAQIEKQWDDAITRLKAFVERG